MSYKLQKDNSIVIKNIGLDIDGVLIDLQKYQLEKGNLYFSKKFHKNIEQVIRDLNAYDVQDIYGCTKKERMIFWGRYVWEYSLFYPARIGSSEITHKWHNEGRTVDIVTSRVYVDRNDVLGMLFRVMVKSWLHKQNIYYDRIKFCSEKNSAVDKLLACKEYNTDLMSDDKIDNIESISEIIPVACFTANWNLDYEKENVYRVNSLYEIDELIQRIEHEKIKRR
ncbi:MAG: hypothetical protein NC181_04545 [Clostridium sp.]|nr:hypothetical protein [Clostridium sp.]MCM1444556.1 hypothetical protein [Candidatus Amulumruptor caecigallinarius]